MSFAETLQESIDELEAKQHGGMSFLNKEQKELLAYYYQLLKQEWEAQHLEKVTSQKKDGPA